MEIKRHTKTLENIGFFQYINEIFNLYIPPTKNKINFCLNVNEMNINLANIYNFEKRIAK